MRACGVGHGSTHLFGHVRSLTRFLLCFSRLRALAWHVTYLYWCWRAGALGAGVWLPPCLYLFLFAAVPAYAYLLFPFAPYAGGNAGVGMFSRLHPMVGCTPLLTRFSLCFSLRGVARRNILALVFMCVRAVFTLLVPSYHVAFPRRWWSCCACGGLHVRAYPLFPMCAACGGVDARVLEVVVCGSLLASLLCVRGHTFCSLCQQACGGAHVFPASPLGYLCWRGYRCAFLFFVALRSAARNILALVPRWPVRWLLLVHVWFLLVVCGSLRTSFISFFHPSCPSIPFCFSVVVAM